MTKTGQTDAGRLAEALHELAMRLKLEGRRWDCAVLEAAIGYIAAPPLALTPPAAEGKRGRGRPKSNGTSDTPASVADLRGA